MRNRLVVYRIVIAAGAAETRAEKPIAFKDLPSAVRAAAEKLTAGGTVKKVVRETEDGAEAFSVEASVSGKGKEFTFAPDGTLLADEEEIAFAQLPEAVRAAAEKYFGDTRGLLSSKELANNVTSYEVEGKKFGKPVSLKYSAEGALIEEEKDED